MRFLSPLALVGLALIALPIAIHLLVRRRAVRLDFPSLKFLRETPSFRLRPRRIQQPLLLALRVAAIALLVMGLATPLFSFFSKSSRTRVILLDASLSMQARGRVDAAKGKARSLINNLGAGERAGIVAFGSDSLVLSAMTSDKKELTNAVDRYFPTNGAADYLEGFDAAGALLRQEEDGEKLIDLVSDFQVSGLPNENLTQVFNLSIGNTKVSAHPVGAALERNAFLIDEVAVSTESGLELSASELVVVRDERSGTDRTWKLNNTEGSGAGIEWRTETNGQITARIRTLTPDDFEPDDSRFLALELPRAGRALLIEREKDDAAPYLRAALEATVIDLGDKRFNLDHKETLPPSASELSNYSLITLSLHGKPDSNEMRMLADYVRAGGTAWLYMASDFDTIEWNQFAATEEGRLLGFTRVERIADTRDGTGFGTIDKSAPALRTMNKQVMAALRGVRMHQDLVITPRVDAETLIRWNDSTSAFIERRLERGSVLLLATSPGRPAGGLGASPAFPALASSIARFSIAPDNPVAREVGQSVNLGLAPNATVKISDAKGKSSTARACDLIKSPAIYFSEPGIYRIESDNLTKLLAFNTPTAESEGALANVADVDRAFKFESSGSDKQTAIRKELTGRIGIAWRYCLLAAFGLLIAEMFLASKQRDRESTTVETQV